MVERNDKELVEAVGLLEVVVRRIVELLDERGQAEIVDEDGMKARMQVEYERENGLRED